MSKKDGFICIILIFLIIAIALVVMPIIMQNISYHAVCEHERAFFIAESGIKYYIKYQLDGNNDWTKDKYTPANPRPASLTKNFSGGSFTVTPSNPPSPADPKTNIILQSLGQLSLGGVSFNRTVRYTIAKRGIEAFSGKYAFYGGGNGTGNDSLNAISNGIVNGDTYLEGTYTNSNPGNFINNGTVYQNQAQAAIPTVNWAYWQALAAAAGSGHVITVTQASPTYTFSGGIYSGVYYVSCSNCAQGNASLSGMTIFNGTLVATGNITLNGTNISINPTKPTSSTTNPALVAGNDVIASNASNTICNGTIYAYHNISLQQYSNLIVKGVCSFGNNLSATNVTNFSINAATVTDAGGFTGGQGGGGGSSAYQISGYMETQ